MPDLNIGHSLALHLDWFKQVLDLRINQYFEKTDETGFQPPPPPVLSAEFPLDRFIGQHQMNWAEHIVLLLALVPHIQPQILDIFFTDNPNLNRGFTEFGGIKGKMHSGFLPTGETAMFILAGSDIETRLHVMRIFRSEHFLFREGVLKMEDSNTSEPSLSAQLVVTRSFLRLFLWNEVYHPDFGPGFPAKRLSTHLEWNDLVLPEYVLEELDEIKAWITHESTIQKNWQLEKWIKPGYRCLFFGPPGTGKTLTASLLGKELKQEVYRVDLSMVVSKYIGETEKNLAGVFDQAENRNWILFFDEADALFGKRTETQSSHDRYANQEVSYLLQRVEDYDGLVILASNFKGNLDEAFIRRFQAMIHFPVPGPEQRLRLWQKMFTENFKLSPEVDLGEIAERYEISGGEIVNILRTLAIRATQQESREISMSDLLFALRKEYRKSGKIITN